jgi:hypothetical protein
LIHLHYLIGEVRDLYDKGSKKKLESCKVAKLEG